MPKIDEVESYVLPAGALCLTRDGWREELEEVSIEMRGEFGLMDAMGFLWENHKGLLGEGDLVFKLLANGLRPRGYVVFLPKDLE